MHKTPSMHVLDMLIFVTCVLDENIHTYSKVIIIVHLSIVKHILILQKFPCHFPVMLHSTAYIAVCICILV